MATEEFKLKHTKTYTDNYEKGEQYQDFISVELLGKGLVVMNFTSKIYQNKKENGLGLEIKFDGLIKDTQRLYIEIAEKSSEGKKEFTPSGIYRQDGSWLYGIGDYSILYIFGKKTLQRLHKSNPDFIYHPFKDKATSKGFCIPLDKAEEIAEKIYYFDQKNKEELGK